jgi:hypothetical protein
MNNIIIDNAFIGKVYRLDKLAGDKFKNFVENWVYSTPDDTYKFRHFFDSYYMDIEKDDNFEECKKIIKETLFLNTGVWANFDICDRVKDNGSWDYKYTGYRINRIEAVVPDPENFYRINNDDRTLLEFGCHSQDTAEKEYANEIGYLRSRYTVLTVANFNEEHWTDEGYYRSFYDEYNWEDEDTDSSIGWDFDMLSNLEQIKYISNGEVVYNYLLPEPRKLTEEEIRANKRKKLQNEINELEASIKSKEMELKELKDKLNIL